MPDAADAGGDGDRRDPPGLRRVLVAAAVVLAVVLGVEALSAVVPAVREAFGSVPITIVVLVAGTVAVLLAVVRGRPRG